MGIQLRLEFQQNRVADEVSAVTAVVRPILQGLLYSLKKEFVTAEGGHENVKLKMLSRLYRPGDGDCGICFEYAVHDAMNRHEATVQERLVDAMANHCKLAGRDSASILFGAEKSGALRLIDTAKERLTDESIVLAGKKGRPVKLKRHIERAAAALRNLDAQILLPYSIRGIWKADLFVGFQDSDRWVATTVKINPNQLEAAPGLRIGIVPNREGKSDSIRLDNERNLVICPLPHDHDFMQVFYQGWGVVQQFIHADAAIPKVVALPRPPDRQVARYLEERREFPVVDVIDALGPLAQPELLATTEREAELIGGTKFQVETPVLEVPMPRCT